MKLGQPLKLGLSISFFMVIFLTCINSFGNPGLKVSGTFVLKSDQYPVAIKKMNPSVVYVVYSSSPLKKVWEDLFLRNDTIINLTGFIDSAKEVLKAYRLVFESKQNIDSVWQFNTKFQLTDKAINLGNETLQIYAYDEAMRITDKFIYNYRQKINALKITAVNSLAVLLRMSEIYNSYDRNRYSVANVWMLSIGIDDYGTTKWKNSKSDAISYVEFFKQQYQKLKGTSDNSLFQSYLLLDKGATKDSILKVIREISLKASTNDYFIFNFSGQSNIFGTDSINYFFPYDVKGYINKPVNRKTGDTVNILNSLISLNTLQEYLQPLQAVNQLYISEAGPSGNFKTGFIKTLMQNSVSIASILNKNRVIIVPNSYGLDEFYCKENPSGKAPLNYTITSLNPNYNIFELFENNSNAERINFLLKSSLFNCNSYQVNENYFDVFFERKFIQQYNEVFASGDQQTRGLKVKAKDLQELKSLAGGKRYALVVGTDTYSGKGWKKLNNPVKDATAVAEELANSYGFDVQLLENKPMDTIYKAIREYYRIANPNDQIIIYFAGHGDADNELLDDGFIVCADSKSIENDPIRNTYIPYIRLQKILNNIPARQVLVLLDVCHGGMFDQKAFKKPEVRDIDFSTITNRNVLQFLKDKLPLRTRKFLSSVGSEPAFDGTAGQHSPFATLLLAILREKGKGSNGILTVADIFKVLQTASMNETAALKISPAMADFGSVDAFSEFILLPVEEVVVKKQ